MEGAHAYEKYLVRELSVPCVYYDAGFLKKEDADVTLMQLQGLRWEKNGKTARHTTLYGDPASDYHYKRGYASNDIHPWTPLLLDLKRRAEQSYFNITGRVANFNVCLGNKYDNGGQSLGWHSDREEIDPALGGPRLTPICSLSFGAERLFGFHPKVSGGPIGAPRVGEDVAVRLGHGSLVIMDNVCQLLYRHSVIPDDSHTMRINLTFRQKASVAAPGPAQLLSELALFESYRSRFVTATPEPGALPTDTPATASHARDSSFKETTDILDTPFLVGVHGSPEEIVCKYYRYLLAQPATLAFLRERLRGKRLVCDYPPGVPCHAAVLAFVANSPTDPIDASPHPTALYCEKDSQFLAFTIPVKTTEEVAERLADVHTWYPDAQHYAHGFSLSSGAFGADDDREPRHSAADPILGNIRARSCGSASTCSTRMRRRVMRAASSFSSAARICASRRFTISGGSWRLRESSR